MVWIVILCMILVFIMLSRTKKQLSPSVLFFAYWMINILAAKILYNEYSWSGWSSVLILAFCLCYLILENFVYNCSELFSTENKEYICMKVCEKKSIVKLVIVICFISGLLNFALMMKNNQISFNISSFDELISASHQFTVARYGSGEYYTSILQQICLGTMYYGGLISGFYFPFTKKHKDTNLICYIIFIPNILCTILTNGKTAVVFSLLLWVAGFLISKYLCDYKINFGFIIKAFFVAVALLLVFYLSFYIRYGGQSTSGITNKIIIYATGHVAGFDNWLENYNFTLFGQAYGGKSFENIFNLLHLPVYESKTIEIWVATQYGGTNVQTQFSDFIIDFGIIGTVFWFCLLGFVSGILFQNIGKKNNYALYLTVIAALYFMALYSFLICPFKYTSCLLAFIEFYITLRIIFGGNIIVKI